MNLTIASYFALQQQNIICYTDWCGFKKVEIKACEDNSHKQMQLYATKE